MLQRQAENENARPFYVKNPNEHYFILFIWCFLYERWLRTSRSVLELPIAPNEQQSLLNHNRRSTIQNEQ